MDDRKAASPGPRVVVLSRDPSVGVRADDGERAEVSCVRVPSPYEAAAEILAAPAAMLVVDLPSLGRSHGRLVKIAREMGLEVLGVGKLPAGMEAGQLAGVRLIGRDELEQTIQDLAEQQRATPAPPAPEPVQAGEYAPEPEPAPFEPADFSQAPGAEQVLDEDLAYLEEQPHAEPPPETFADQQYEAEPPPETPADEQHEAEPAAQVEDEPALADAKEPSPAPPSASAENLLTPEELSALLENEQ